MQRPTLIFENHPLFLALCVLLGLAYAYLLYQKKGTWNENTNKALFALRFLLATVLAALLISPVIKQVQNTVEPPKYVIAVDNSQSIKNASDSVQLQTLKEKLKQLEKRQKEKGFEVVVYALNGDRYESTDQLGDFDYPESDLEEFLTAIRSDYEGKNLGGITLVSDGIYNNGISPTFRNYAFQIETVGVGDSIPKSDISINELIYNKISYQGNKFPIVVQVKNKGFEGESVSVSVVKNNAVLETKTVNLKRDNNLEEVEFLLEANDKGFQRYTIRVAPLEGEYTTLNNVKQAYVEVIEGTENIALIAAAPHPDIKAMRSAIESNSNYSFDQYILSLAADRERFKQSTKKYDLFILHQLPDLRGYHRLVNLDEPDIPKLYVYGGLMDLNQFSSKNKTLEIKAVPGQYDNVTASFNQAFVNFQLSNDLQQTFSELPPISVPFGKIDMSKGSKSMLYQQVGSIVTNKPLIAINEELEPKEAVILGNGIWQWKLTSYVINENHDAFNELISKLIQYLSSKEDKRKFKVYPIRNEFTSGSPVVFETEIYNDLYEPIYGQRINLQLKGVEGKNFDYTFVTNKNNTRYTISGLPQGVYTYKASTNIAEEMQTVSGEIVIKELEIENINLTADFDLLRSLSNKTGGTYTYYTNLNSDNIETPQATGVIHTSEKYLPFINLKWLFFMLLILISVEWFIRKFSGSY